MVKIFEYCAGTIIRPKKTFERLSQDKKQYLYSWVLIGVLSIAWEALLLANLFLGMQALPHPKLMSFPGKYYYVWLSLTAVPVIIACYAMVLGIIALLYRMQKKDVEIAPVFSTMSFAFSVPSFIEWGFEVALLITMIIKKVKVPAGFMTFIPIPGYKLHIFGPLILLPIALHVTLKIPWWKAVIYALIASVPYLGFQFMIFLA